MNLNCSKAVVIFSGGQDSTTCLGWAKNRYDEVVAMTFFYGQKHNIEIERAKEICKIMGVEQHIIDIPFFGQLVDSALTHNGVVNEKHSRIENLPASFVPNRNQMFITIAHAFAQKIGADTLITGVCETDYSGYPDCRNEFIKSIEQSTNLGSSQNIKIETPLMYLNKAETFKMAEQENIIDIVLNYSHTCYNGSEERNSWGYGCGSCPACNLRHQGYRQYIERYINQEII